MTEIRFDPTTGADSPAHVSPSPKPSRSFWPWIWFAIVAGLGLSLLWRSTAPPVIPERVAIPAPVVEPTSDVPLLLTALANLPGSAGNPAIMATAEPTQTQTPFARRPTETPYPPCPANPGAVCQWPQPTPTWAIKPDPTPYPICVTPVIGERCRDVGASFADPLLTPHPTSEPCGNPFGGPWPTLSPEFATITPTWATPTPNPACVTPTPTPEAHCWPAGWHSVCWQPTGCRALWDGWCGE